MPKKLAAIILSIFIVLQSAVPVVAQTSPVDCQYDASGDRPPECLFETYYTNCNFESGNARGCTCKYLLRDGSTGQIFNSDPNQYEGFTDDNNLDLNKVNIYLFNEETRPYLQWATIKALNSDVESQKKDNCYSEQNALTKDGSNFDIKTAAIKGFIAFKAGGAAGSLVGAPYLGLVTGIGAFATDGGWIDDAFRDLLGTAWSAHQRSGNYNCNFKTNYSTTYAISEWHQIDYEKDKYPIRLDYKGDVGWPLSDVFYCGMMIATLNTKNLEDANLIGGTTQDPFNLCNQASPMAGADGESPRQKCQKCQAGTEGSLGTGVWTSLGCIQNDNQSLVASLLRIGLSLAGLIALLTILASAFMFSTSQGDVKRTNDAKEMLTSAIIGLIFIIFSITILQFIGVTILQIPGLQ